ncbi:MAG: hypothetical protein GDA48_28995 [Hormoscilla sp. GM102CHS1]|nr:hypothetical protein [Hormoscilla sp. GM102CHS1]
MAATSEEFKAALKEGRIADALKTALGQSIKLEITTKIASSDPETASQIREKGDSGEIMRTRFNIVEGKIETEIGSKFLKGGKFAELRDFHVSQMQASGQIIERNISSLQKLLELWVGMTQQTIVVTDSKTHSSELKSIQPDALAYGSIPRLAAFSAPDLRERKEELRSVVARSELVTTGVTGGTEREQEVTSSEEHDPEVLAAFDLDPSVSPGAASPGSAKSTFPGSASRSVRASAHAERRAAVGTRGGTRTTDGLAFTGDPEIAVPSTENVRENSALKTAAVVAGTAAVVGTAVAAAAGAWGSDEAAASGDLTLSEALDIDVTTTSPMAEEFEESQELASCWDETELPETTPSEEPVMSESTAIDGDPEALVESILESEPVTEDPELEMMDGTEQLASCWDETELWEDEPEPEAIEPDLLAETLVASLTDEDVIEESTEDSEVEIMGALETEESGSPLAKEDETAEILGVLETERELAPSWDGTELRSNTEAESLALGIDEVSADMMGAAEDELAANWEEPETSWETGSDSVPENSEWGRHGDLQDDYSAVESEMSLAEALAEEEWPTDEEEDDEEAAEESASSRDLESLWVSPETQEAQATDELGRYGDWEIQVLAEDRFGSAEAAPLGSDEDLSLWEEPETEPLADADYESEVPGEAAADDDAFGMNGMGSNLDLPDSESNAFAQADNADPLFASEMSDYEELTDDDEDAALMSAFDSDADADRGFDEPQPFPGTTGGDRGMDGEVLDDVFSSDMSETATEASQAPALDEFDVDLLGEHPELGSDFSGTVPQGNGTKKATATAGDNSGYEKVSDDPLAALLDEDDGLIAPAQACTFKGEAAFDPLAELFAGSDQVEDLNYGSEGTDELDALFSDDVNAGNLEDSFADLELAEPPSGSPQIKKKVSFHRCLRGFCVSAAAALTQKPRRSRSSLNADNY